MRCVSKPLQREAIKRCSEVTPQSGLRNAEQLVWASPRLEQGSSHFPQPFSALDPDFDSVVLRASFAALFPVARKENYAEARVVDRNERPALETADRSRTGIAIEVQEDGGGNQRSFLLQAMLQRVECSHNRHLPWTRLA